MTMEERVYIVCYKIANELANIKLYMSYEKALEILAKNKETHQILEYLVIDEIAERPLFTYMFENDRLIRRRV